MSFAAIARNIAIRAVVRPALVLTTVGGVTSYGSEIHDLRGQLPVSPTSTYGKRPMEAIRGVVFHHSATRGATISSIADMHIEQRKWPGIAYHIAIGYDGKIYLLHDLTTVSYHTAGNNYRNIGVVLIGNYHERETTPEMEAAILKVMSWLGEQVDLQYVWLHRDVRPTACPGKYAVPYLRGIQFGELPS